MNKIVVVGSSNIDMMAKVSHLPGCGETVGEAEFSQAIGGKGMNQAIAAARLGGQVTFVTALGRDHYAGMLRDLLRRERISTDYVFDTADHATGTALIFVSRSGDNCIAVAPGANGTLHAGMVDTFISAINDADVVLMQAEIPFDTIRATAKTAHGLGKKVIFNLAPATEIDDDLLGAIDVLVVNEVEAGVVAGVPYDGSNLDRIMDALYRLGVPNVVVTAGAAGAYLITPFGRTHVAAYRVQAIDTIAAGDTFCGALAVNHTGEYITEEQLRYANAASAIAVTRPGATTSIPTCGEVAQFIESQDTQSIPDEQLQPITPSPELC